ncbi:MAG TPA: site-specific integrase [Methylibium sp.]|nr:site-specific integrase [Methylibium sp.]
MALWANAMLEQALTMTQRRDLWNLIGADFLGWTINDQGISADGEEDSRNLQNFLKGNPKIAAAVARRFEREYTPAEQAMHERVKYYAAQHQAESLSGQANGAPDNPMRMSEAITLHLDTGKVKPRTKLEKGKVLGAVAAHVVQSVPTLGPDPWVHDVKTHHLAAFLDTVGHLHTTRGSKTAQLASARTTLKKTSHIVKFFAWAAGERQMTRSDPALGLAQRIKELKEQVGDKQARSYAPFKSEHLSKIFAAEAYLGFNRSADYFWAPLIAAHVGSRLKEILTLRLSDIHLHEPTGIWVLNVKIDEAKNRNSARRLPVPRRLVEIGFIEYVEHVQALGADRLFPHVDFESRTLKNDPSKYVSRQFGEYLSLRGISDPALVCHSFRHTIVSALQDNNVPVNDAMQLVGHQAQSAAVLAGELTVGQTRSVHLKTYAQANRPRLNVDHPIERLKGHLDAVNLGLDYVALRKAAAIVRESTVRGPKGFKSGWSVLSKGHAERLARLG